MLNILVQELQAEATDEEEFKKKIADTEKYYKYDYKDFKEDIAQKTMSVLRKELNIENKSK